MGVRLPPRPPGKKGPETPAGLPWAASSCRVVAEYRGLRAERRSPVSYCPACRYEYSPDVKECPDCGAKLVDKLPQEGGVASEGLVCVSSYPFEIDAQIAKLTLRSRGVEAVVTNELSGATVGIDTVWLDGGFKLMVRKEESAKARRILESK